MTPRFTRAQVLAALAHYDQTIRPAEEGASWEHNRAHRWAVEHDGQRYPVKQIAGLAVGVEPGTFSGGAALNRRFIALGFTIVAVEHPPTEPAGDPPSEDATHDPAPDPLQQAHAHTAQLRAALTAALAHLRHDPACAAAPCTCGAAEALRLGQATLLATDDPPASTPAS
ncbi:MAG TPA: hypothetical protein VFS21_20320 [Roseiflexaceae bacterium]|nr:hypothetical protein [Roseiflexaceae bacterium]